MQDNRTSSEPSNRVTATDTDPEALQRSRRLCRSIATSTYENFLVATVFLPKRLRQPFHDVYAFCRTADDIADESDSPEAALAGLDRYAEQLGRIESQESTDGIFVALGNTIRSFNLPVQPFHDLLVAFRQDQEKDRYETNREVLEYCRFSANPVGRIVLGLSGALNATNAEFSDSVCTGLQLANFLQDVQRDWAKDRVYLAAETMHQYGVDVSMLDDSTTSEPLKNLLRDECDRTDAMLRRGLPLTDRVPRWLSKDIRLFVHGGLQTINAIRKIDYDVLRVRPKVSKWTQLRLLGRAAIGTL